LPDAEVFATREIEIGRQVLRVGVKRGRGGTPLLCLPVDGGYLVK